MKNLSCGLRVGFLSLVALLCSYFLHAQERALPAISWERTDDVPQDIILGIHCRGPFSIDWGDGNLEEFSARNYGVNGIRGAYKGKEVKIYGDPNDFISLYLGNEERGNGVRSLDISRLKMLRFLHCPNNQLSELNLASGYSLEELHLANNQLQSISLVQSPRLDMLICYGNRLQELDLKENVRLQALRCEGNQISTLDVSHLTDLTVLRCSDNPIDQLDISQNKKLQQLYVEGCPIRKIETGHLEDLRVLGVSRCGLSQLDVCKNKALHVLYANGNALTELTLTQISELEKVEVKNNQLRSLRVEAPILTDLRCSQNSLQSLDLSGLPLLRYLFCEQNMLSSLDLAKNPELCELLASDNRLKSLDLSQNKKMYLLWLDGNEFEKIDITPCALQLFSLFLARNRFSPSEMQRLVNQLPDITSVEVSPSKAWWKRWLRIKGNPNVEQVDLTIPLKNGWRIDTKEQWPGNPEGVAEVVQSPLIITQEGNRLLLSAFGDRFVTYDIYTAWGAALLHNSLRPSSSQAHSLPSPGCYLLVIRGEGNLPATVYKIIVP